MKKVAELSNQNLVCNSDAYISNGGKINPDNEFSWIDDSYKQVKEKFQLRYEIFRLSLQSLVVSYRRTAIKTSYVFR